MGFYQMNISPVTNQIQHAFFLWNEGCHAPNKKITRQEMFTLLYHTLKAIRHLPQGNLGKSLDQFTDSNAIDSWAMDAMKLLTKTGTINGNNGTLNLLITTNRAEIAQVLYNLLNK